MKMQNIFFIAFYFPPINQIASDRSFKFVKSLLDAGHKVTVFMASTKNVKKNYLAHSQQNFSHPNLTIIEVPTLVNNHSFYSNSTFFKRLSFYFFTMLFKDLGYLWFPNLYQALKKQKKPDLIIATGNPFVTFLVPYFLKIPYILDFRDLWSDNPVSVTKINCPNFLINFIEKLVIKNAKNIITISKAYKEVLVKKYSLKNVVVLYNLPSLSLKFEHPSKLFSDQYLNFVYVGTLYKDNRSFEPILLAIKKLDYNLQLKIRIHYYGVNSERAIYEFEKFGLKDLLIDHGFVTKNEASDAILSADLLLSFVGLGEYSKDLTEKGIITTKIFEYLLANKIILNIAPKDNELNELIDCPSFFSFDSTAVDKIADFLANFKVQEVNNKIMTWEEQFSNNFREFL